MRSWLQTRRSEPSWARTRFRPPTSTPSPVESRKSTPSMSTTRWKLPSFTSSTSCSRSLGAVYTSISPPTSTTVRSPTVRVDRDRSTNPPAPCYRAVARWDTSAEPPERFASRDGIQSLTGRRARRLGPIVRHASDTLGADGQESANRSTLGGPRVRPLAEHGSGPAGVGTEPGFAHHSYGALALTCGPPCRLA